MAINGWQNFNGKTTQGLFGRMTNASNRIIRTVVLITINSATSIGGKAPPLYGGYVMVNRGDIDYFKSRERTSLEMAAIATDRAARFSHLELARHYRLRGDMAPVGLKPA